MVEYRDGSFIAQLGPTDMRVPISHCLAWPERLDEPSPRLEWSKMANLTFEEPDLVRFPSLALAREAMSTGGAAPTILNAANEIAVAEFLGRRLGFAGIPALVEATMSAAARRGLTKEPGSVEDAISVDHISRSLASDLLPEIAAKAS
jgi:1-deoxy-D-xylulose-5-phosphate reductoisomerase